MSEIKKAKTIWFWLLSRREKWICRLSMDDYTKSSKYSHIH